MKEKLPDSQLISSYDNTIKLKGTSYKLNSLIA